MKLPFAAPRRSQGKVLALLPALCASVYARPGSVIEGTAALIQRPGQVAAVSVAENGSVNLAGVFSQVNGRPAPGLVRLKNDGTVDESFTPGVGLVARPGLVPLFQPLAVAGMCPAFQLWPGGEMWVGDVDPGAGGQQIGLQWVVLDINGQIEIDPLPGLPSTEPLMPQFIRDGKLTTLISRRDPATGRRQTMLRRVLISSGLDDPSFQITESGATPRQAIPAADGGLWLLESAAGSFFNLEYRLTKLTAAGQPDAALPPHTFPAYDAALQETGGGTFALTTSEWLPYWPSPSWDHRLEFRTAGGAPAGPGAAIPLYGQPPFLGEPDGSVVMQEPSSGWLMSDPEPQRRTLWRRLPDGTADPGFHPSLATQSIARLPDGRLLADGQRRYLPNGNVDPAWSVPAVLDHGNVAQLIAGPNKTVYGAGDFTAVNGQLRPGLARWLADGGLDVWFAPAAADGSVMDFAVLTDGRVMVLRDRDGRTTLDRLRPDGANDASFQLIREGLLFPADQIRRIEPLPDGGVLALVVWQAGDIWEQLIVRVSSAGTVTRLLKSDSVFDYDLLALPDGRFFHQRRRWLANGNPDSTFNPSPDVSGVPLCAAAGGWLWRKASTFGALVLLRDDGSLNDSFSMSTAAGRGSACSGPGRALYVFSQDPAVLTRHYADGRRDPSFAASALIRRHESVPDELPLVGAAENGFITGVQSALVHPVTGELWIAGDFTRTGGLLRTGLARLNASIPSGFGVWRDAIFGDAPSGGAHADPDGDGAENWREYAAGTDPLSADAVAGQLEILTTQPLSVSAPRNPAAPEVTVTLEVSADLHTWRTTTGAEAVRKTVRGRDAFELAPAAGKRYVRIRYSTQP